MLTDRIEIPPYPIEFSVGFGSFQTGKGMHFGIDFSTDLSQFPAGFTD